ncbi:hypothetical protein [Pseudomonas sp. NPDC089534]|uniref:hypothetical protein n=1 Tax=Pseudomonas sp. NPDC089534 TaxID=3364468 RepID=UPI0037F26805
MEKTPTGSGFFFGPFLMKKAKKTPFDPFKLHLKVLQKPFQTGLQMPEILSHGRKFSTL